MEERAPTAVTDFRDILDSLKRSRAPKSVNTHNTEELSVKSDITHQEQEQENDWGMGTYRSNFKAS